MLSKHLLQNHYNMLLWIAKLEKDKYVVMTCCPLGSGTIQGRWQVLVVAVPLSTVPVFFTSLNSGVHRKIWRNHNVITMHCFFMCTSVHRESLERCAKMIGILLNPFMLVLMGNSLCNVETVYSPCNESWLSYSNILYSMYMHLFWTVPFPCPLT